MKRIQIFSVLCLLTAAMDATAQAGPGLAMPSDFNFVFQYEHGHILDTSKGTFTRDGAIPTSSLTVTMKLTAMEMEDIYHGLVSIDFWNNSKYPEVFTITPKGSGILVSPAGTDYRLRVTSNGAVKQLRWEDKIIEHYQPAEELREVFKRIRLIIESTPEYKNLPPSQVKYIN